MKLAGTGDVRGNGRNPWDRYLLGTMNPKIAKMVRPLILGGSRNNVGCKCCPRQDSWIDPTACQGLVMETRRRRVRSKFPSRQSGPAHINETKAIVQGIEEAEPYCASEAEASSSLACER